MEEEKIREHQTYSCSHHLLEQHFLGEIIKKNQKTCIVEGIEYGPKDQGKGLEYNHRYVVRFEQIEGKERKKE